MLRLRSGPLPPFENNTKSAPADGPGEIAFSVRACLRFVRRRWWIILLAIAISMVVSAIKDQRATPIYRGAASIHVGRREPIAARVGTTVPSEYAMDNSGFLATEIELIRSDVVLRDAVRRGNLAALESFRGTNDPTGLLTANLTIQQRQRHRQFTQVLELLFESHVSADCVPVLDAVIQAYLAFHASAHKQSASEVLHVLQQQRRALSQELRDKEAALLTFRGEHQIFSNAEEYLRPALHGLRVFQEDLAAAQRELIEADAVWQSMPPLPSTAPVATQPDVRTEPGERFGQLRAYLLAQNRPLPSEAEMTRRRPQLVAEQARLGRLQRVHHDAHPKVKAARRSFEDLTVAFEETKREYRRRLINQVGDLATAARLRRDAAAAKAQRLQQRIRAEREGALAVDRAASEHAMHARDAERTNRALEAVIARIGEVDLAQDYGTLVLRLINPPRTGSHPVKPNRRRHLGIAAGIGLLIGLGIAFLANEMDSSLRSIDEVDGLEGVPLLGALPRGQCNGVLGGIALRPHTHPRSAEAEAFRTLRTAVHFRAASNGTKTVLVTSPNSADGKTTVACGLAICDAQHGARVLLVDADFRRPTLARLFKCDGDTAGIVHYLSGAHGPEQAVVSSGISNLDLAPAGAIPPNPSELVNSDRFSDFLDWASARYDRVVLDSPPVQCVSEPLVIASLADSVILVARLGGRTAPRHVRSASRALRSAGGVIIGVVANAFGKHDGYSYDRYAAPYLHTEEDGTNGRTREESQERVGA